MFRLRMFTQRSLLLTYRLGRMAGVCSLVMRRMHCNQVRMVHLKDFQIRTDIYGLGSGQGASMALEDCETLALLLAHYQDREQEGWRLALKLYSDMRIPRLRWIRMEAQKRGAMKKDMGIVQEMLMYFFIWLSGE